MKKKLRNRFLGVSMRLSNRRPLCHIRVASVSHERSVSAEVLDRAQRTEPSCASAQYVFVQNWARLNVILVSVYCALRFGPYIYLANKNEVSSKNI